MPNSVLGIVFLIVFLAPGFVMILVVRKSIPLFAAGQSQIESVLWGCITGLVTHFCVVILFALLGFCVLALRDSGHVTLSSYFVKKVQEFVPKDAKNIEVWHLLFGLLYIVLVFGVAVVMGACLSRRLRKKGFGVIGLSSPWVEAFSTEQVNFARALLDNDYVVIGIVESIQSDLKSLTSGNRDIVFCSTDIFDPNGLKQPGIADKITVNTRDIKILEIAT